MSQIWRMLRKILGQPEAAAHERNEAENRDNGANREVARAIQELRGEIERQGADTNQRHRHDEEKRVLGWLALLVNGITMSAVIYYGCVARGQWDAMTAANKIASGRAWAVPKIRGDYLILPNMQTKVRAEVHNSGKMLAHHVSAEFSVGLFRGPETAIPKTLHTDPLPQGFITRKSTDLLIAPGDSLRFTFGITIPETVAVADIANEQYTVLIYGRLVYTDDDGTHGDTGFCRVYDPKGREFNFCSTVPDWIK
jgi:hypothetical protein